MHKEDETTYIAYAQWPSKAHWEASGEGLPPEADAVRERMRACCISVERLHELKCIKDFLHQV